LGYRISITLEKDLEEKLRLKQGELIIQNRRNTSFSGVINEVLKKGLKEKVKLKDY